MQAYFSYVNADADRRKRGVGGRQIVLKYLRRRLQPGEHGPADAEARRAGQGLRARRRRSAPSRSRRSRLPEPAKVPQIYVSTGATEFEQELQATAVDDRLAARLPGGGPRSTAATSCQNLPNAKIGDHLPERQLRQGLHRRPQVGPRLHKSQNIVSQQGFDVTATCVANQVAALRRVGRRHAVDLRARRRRRSARTRRWRRVVWKPANDVIVNSVSATDTFMRLAAGAAPARRP